ncbi:MAG TPA: polymer-forming cytoskeletal protein [Vicinamibacterales bacterium]|nr:polymer-forming cytoskeletal protein [Vicinamibacterales bacterium]
MKPFDARRFLPVTVLLGALAAAHPAAAAPAQPAEIASARAELRERLEDRYEVVPLSRGVGLRPLRRRADARLANVRLIEVSDHTIAIDGTPVSGAELRDRLGAEADLILALSYLDPDERRRLFGFEETQAAEPAPPATPSEPAAPPAPPASVERPERRWPERRRRSQERVNLFGDVRIERDEVASEAVAILGSVDVDGEVTGDVTAVMGSVRLGPDARVGGQVTAVGGRVRRAPGAEVHGGVTEVALGDMGPWHGHRWWWAMPFAFQPFAGLSRFMLSLARALLVAIVVSLVVLLAGGPVERIAARVTAEPLRSGAVGLLAAVLVLPTLVVTCVILAVSIIGIPLLLLVPFAIVALLFVLLGGFAGSACGVGRLAAARLGWRTDRPLVLAWLGVALILAPILVSRLVGIAGGPFYALSLVLAAIGFVVEFAAWTMGFGAVLLGWFERWRTRRVESPPAPAAG